MSTTENAGRPGKPDRTLVAVLLGVAAIVVVALAVVFLRGETPQYDAATPEGVVQRYATDIIAGDESAATSYLSDAAVDGCALDGGYGSNLSDDVRVALVSTTVRADSADVKVSITASFEDGALGSSESTSTDVFDLVRVDGRWLIDSAPWQFQICPDKAATP